MMLQNSPSSSSGESVVNDVENVAAVNGSEMSSRSDFLTSDSSRLSPNPTTVGGVQQNLPALNYCSNSNIIDTTGTFVLIWLHFL